MSVAKCHNVTGCLLAYRGEDINLAANAPLVCPECGKPVTVTNPLNSSIKKGLMALVALVVLAAAVWAAKPMLAGLMHPGPAKPVLAGASPTVAPMKTTPAPVPNKATPTPIGKPTPEPAIPPSPPLIKVEPKFTADPHIQDEVEKRIDVMPNISGANKDKLYASVHRARSMGLVLTIQFGSGKTSLTPAELQQLKTALEKDEIKGLREDPTAVFVILGYADPQGDDKKNYKISLDRAEGVTEAMKDKCGVINVMHSVAMGGQTLVDSKVREKNRVVEVWAVLP